MKCMTSVLLVGTVAFIASAVRVPSSWEEEQDYEPYTIKLRKTRQKPLQKPVLERRVGGFAQANHGYKSKKPYRSKDDSTESIPVIQSRYGEDVPIIIPLINDEIVNQPVYQNGYQNIHDPTLVQTSEENVWIPITTTSQFPLPLQNVKSDFQYNGIVRNSVINEENPMYQRWQESKVLPKLKSRNHSHQKTLNELAEADLIRQLEKHKIIQQNLAAVDTSPGRLRRIYLEDQLNRNAINLNHQPISSGTKINPLEITFTTSKPEINETKENKLKRRPRKRKRHKVIKNKSFLSSEKENEVEKRKNILAYNHRDDELHEPHKDTSERDDTLHEPENDNDTDKLDDTQQDLHDKDEKDNQIQENENNHQGEVVISEEENEKSEEENEESNEEAIQSEHANPKNIPTKPIYPGEGQWAQPGKKYRPYYTQHRFVAPEDPQEKKPEGYDVFEDLTRYFDMQRANFERQGRFTPDDNVPTTQIPSFAEQLHSQILTPPPNTWRPNPPVYSRPSSYVNPVQPLIVYDPFSEPSNSQGIASNLETTTHVTAAGLYTKSYRNEKEEEEKSSVEAEKEEDHDEQEELNQNEYETNKDAETAEEENLEDEDLEIDPDSVGNEYKSDEDDFTPMQLYTQVRHSANIQHLPSDPEESGRLKEVIRDSKVQTVYTEEGYEDLAYDHAGHEKKAESDEGFAEFEKNKEEKGNLQNNIDSKESIDKGGFSTKPIDSELRKNGNKDTVSEYSNKHPIANKQNNKNFLSTKKVNTMELKDKGNGELQMEIQREIKTVMQPNNSDSAQSSLTIYPKIFQEVLHQTENNIKVFVQETTTISSNENKDAAQNFTSSVYNTNNTETPLTKPYFDIKNVNQFEEVEIVNKINSQPDVVTYHEDSSTTEFYTTEGYFHPETDNLNVEDISVKSVADIFFQLNNKNTQNALQQNINPLDKIDNKFKKNSETLKRKKRGSGFLNVKVDTDFIDKIDHSLPPKKPKYDRKKYPYYENKTIAENSPLRYAESLLNVPDKRKNELSFYKKAEKMECPELDEPNPIPDHVKFKTNIEYDEYEEKETNPQSGAPKPQRIELGTKIDCYKKRYFGENPLDSPFFKEEFVGPVKPIFKELMQKKSTISKDSEIKESMVINTVDKANEIFNKLNSDLKLKYLSDLKNKQFAELTKQTNADTNHAKKETIESKHVLQPRPDSSEFSAQNVKRTTSKPILSTTTSKTKPLPHIKEQPSTPLPLPTLMTTPKYTLKLTPQNIYDQISLLDHLDVSGTEFLPNESDLEIVPVEANRRESKSINVTEEISNVESQALRRRRKPQKTRSNYNIILNRRSSTTTMTPYSIINTNPTTVLPKYKVISEVFYKDEIQPNEQLAVFSDILNNIRNASKLEEQAKIQSISNFAEPFAVTISSVESLTKRSNHKMKTTAQDAHTNEPDLSALNTIDTPNHKISTYRPLNNNMIKLLDKNLPKYNSQTIKISPSQPGRKRIFSHTNPITTRRTIEQIYKTPLRKHSQPNIIDFDKETEGIVGLVPPSDENYNTIILDHIIDKEDISVSIELPLEHLHEYKTILPTSTEQLPAPVSESLQEPIVIQLNKYLFLGLKPPRPQKVKPFTDFVTTNKRKDMVSYVRIKREAQRPAYSELSRNRGRQEEILEKPNIEDDDIDDYVPHRPRNYYYDEETGQIVYLNKPKLQSSEEEEEDEVIEYEEITEARPPPQATSPKIETKLLLATAKPPLPGESFIDFLSKVKSDPNYKSIPDPTTTEKSSVPAKTAPTNLRPTISTAPPEFLSILAKVKSDSSYKSIDDPENKNKKITTTTTDAPLVEIEQDDEEYDKKHVESQSGIFDISEYLPEVKEYTPKTSIDYSKYKTINRSTTKQRPSVTQNVENIDYTAIVRARKPIYDDDEKTLSRSTTTIETPQEIETRRIYLTETDRSTTTEDRYDPNQSSELYTTPAEKPSAHISQNRRRPSKTATTTSATTHFEVKSEKNLEILAPPVQTRRGTRLTTTLPVTTPTVEIQEPLTRLPTKRRRTTTPSGYQTSLELVTTTEAVLRVYPENQRAKRVYRRQPVHIRHKATTEIFDELNTAKDATKILPRRSEQLSDVQRSFLNPILTEDGSKDFNDREDRSIDQSVNLKNQNQDIDHRKDVEIFKEYDKSKKHGGNFIKENEDTDEEPNGKEQKAGAKAEDTQKEVYIVLRTSRQNNGDNKNEKLTVNNLQSDQVHLSQKDQVEVIGKIDKRNRTGGSYKSEDEIVEEEVQSKVNTLQILKGVNIEPEEQDYDETQPTAIKSKRLILNLKNSDITEKPERLTDVVPKPDHFYSDPGLPKQVNRLRDGNKRVNSEELDEIVTEGDHNYSSEEEFDDPVPKENQMRDRIDNENEEDTLEKFDFPEKFMSTKRPNFIKDPEKRLYYYATV